MVGRRSHSSDLSKATRFMSLETRPARIVSMDQFRGYTVAGMLLVNYVGGMQAFHAVFKHHGVYFSYADSIMPSFFFAVGYSFRLTIVRRLQQLGMARTCWTYFRRSLSLILISLMFYGFGIGGDDRALWEHWDNYSWQRAWHLVTQVIKSDLWETLALIGVTQIFLLPFIGRSLKFRVCLMTVCLTAHAVLSWLFNFNFSHQQPNALEHLLVNWIDWGAADKRCWESGPFGVLNWSVAMLLGSIAYDVVLSNRPGTGAAKLILMGGLCMTIGYGLSCLTRLYDVDKGEGIATSAAASADASIDAADDPADDPADDAPPINDEEAPTEGDQADADDQTADEALRAELAQAAWGGPPKNLERFAESPVWLPLERAQGQPLENLLAEPPFVRPPEPSVRRINYWMMTKQLPSPSFILFASGFAAALYGLFVVACDIGPLRIGLFRTFGQNPLATYLLHAVVAHTLEVFNPADAPLGYCLASVTVFFLIVYGLIRGLEKQGIYIRL